MNKDLIAKMNHGDVQARLKEIKNELDAEGADVDALTEETDMLLARDKAIKEDVAKRKKLAQDIANGIVEAEDVQNEGNVKRSLNDLAEKRAKAFREKRSVTVSAGELLIPTHESSTLNPTFQAVSSLADKFSIKNLDGGESYSEAYVIGYGEAGITDEGAVYTDSDPTFGYADMNKIKITCITKFTEETRRLPNVNYQAEILKNVSISMKRKLVEQAILGGGTKEMMGIFGEPVAIDDSTDMEITSIDKDTLNDIVMNYGGDEAVEGNQVLLLNKNTLRDFSKVRFEDGRRAYEIDYKNKTIDGVPYEIVSNILSFNSARSGDFVMAYGNLNYYRIAQMSPMEVRMTDADGTDFQKGIESYRASMFVAGNVVAHNAFLRIKKKVNAG